ncbi:MAG: DUF2911 domain-containing protein [Chitinophagaceae bacterium]|nr:DUF2911 domain-containing protein [Chitinophagaceae bacterium]MCW5904741.1 DUF2911 domain-containing protein [Chitinophagaceae bacterium]
MKKLLFIATSALMSFGVEAQIKMPAPSPTQTISQNFGLGKIELSYSRPSIKGREVFKEGSELAPLKNVWRTGANGATTLHFTDEVSINGVKLAPGKYGLLTIPGNTEWTIIITKDTTVTSPAAYKQENDLTRVYAKTMKMREKVETFTMQFANVQAESCELHLMWGNTTVSLPIATNIKDKVRKQTEQALAAEKVSGNTYYTAANFYYEYDKDYSKALMCVSKAIDASPKSFWMYMLKARIENAAGDKVSAKKSAEQCIEVAKEQKNDDYVRMATKFIKEL